MTREEQIREASIDYQISTNPRAIGGDVFADMTRRMNVNPSFIAGAIWSDNNPSSKALAEELYRLGYTTTLNGDIISRAEEEKAMKSYIEHRISRVIENACEWLNDNTVSVVDDACTRMASHHGIGKEEFIEQFKKAMGEQL